MMVGPQAAAVFGIYALLESPETFQAFFLNDPCRADYEARSLCGELVGFAATPEARGKYFAVSHEAADDAITGTAERRIRDAADIWLSRHPGAAGLSFRFDVVLIAPWRLPKHVPNAF